MLRLQTYIKKLIYYSFPSKKMFIFHLHVSKEKQNVMESYLFDTFLKKYMS